MDRVIEFISSSMTAMSNCSLYGREHPAVLHLSEKAAAILDALYVEDKFSIALYGDRVVVNELPLGSKNIYVSDFVKKLKRKGIDKIVISKGVTAQELREFLSEVAVAEKITGDYPHITHGVIEVKLGSAGGVDVSAVMGENISKVKEVYHGVSRFKRLDMVGLEDVVVSFISTIRQEANVLRVISPVKSHSEYTYTHNTNVAVLSIFQAESLGIRNELLHDIGLAGLLHDIGKMFVSREVLEKETKLDEAEWAEMKKHPAYGSLYLATLPDIPKYALIAAFEHHMKFNGSGYPQTRRKTGRQHIISQIIAISDFFDALRTERPYRRSVDVAAIVGLITESSGRDFNPMLVENFVRSLKKASAFTA